MFKEGDECFKGWDRFTILSFSNDMVELESGDERIFCGAHNVVEVNEGRIEISDRIKTSLYKVTSKGSRLINHREVRRFYESLWSLYIQTPSQSTKDTININIDFFEKEVSESVDKINDTSILGYKVFELQF